MSFESHGSESPQLKDKSKHRKKHHHHHKDRESTKPEDERPEKDKFKTTGSPFLGEKKKPVRIEVMEESGSVTGGLAGIKSEALPKSGKSFWPSDKPSGSKRDEEKPSPSKPQHTRPVETMQENRFASAARELKDAAWRQAVEFKETSFQYASQLRDSVQDAWGGKPQPSTWELYGKKKKQALCLHEQAEQKMREARMAPPERAHDLYLDAQVLKQRALKKSVKAQSLAQQMLYKIDEKVNQYERTSAPLGETKISAWEMYGKCKSKASTLHSRAMVKEHEARNTTDYRRAAELLEEAGRLKARALRKAEEAKAYAEGIKKAADSRVVDLRKWADSESSTAGQY